MKNISFSHYQMFEFVNVLVYSTVRIMDASVDLLQDYT